MKLGVLKLVWLAAFLLILSICLSDTNGILTEIDRVEDTYQYYEDWGIGFGKGKLEELLGGQYPEVSTKDQEYFPLKETNKPIFVHYMPWFQTKDIDGKWGQHWTMTNKNPDKKDTSGRRQIASHYYPLIGPYSTKDVTVQQYHLLLMTLSGVQGVVFDWYGIQDIYDFQKIKEGMESFVDALEKTPLKFAVMYEDRVIYLNRNTSKKTKLRSAIADFKYIEKEYFTSPNYFMHEKKPLLLIFGPNYLENPKDWITIKEAIKTPISLLSLWGVKKNKGMVSFSGEYAWIDKEHLTTLSRYYDDVANFKEEIVGGVAYPGFHDFYKQGGWNKKPSSSWRIDNRGIRVFKESFLESQNRSVDFIQIATWNDFGEGTMIEPTLEFGFDYLEALQGLSEVQYAKDDLELVYQMFILRKKYPNNPTIQFLLDVAYQRGVFGDIANMKKIISILSHYYSDPS